MLVQVTSHELCVSSFSCESTHAAYGVGPWSRRAEAGTGCGAMAEGSRPWHGASRLEQAARPARRPEWSWRA